MYRQQIETQKDIQMDWIRDSSRLSEVRKRQEKQMISRVKSRQEASGMYKGWAKGIEEEKRDTRTGLQTDERKSRFVESGDRQDRVR